MALLFPSPLSACPLLAFTCSRYDLALGDPAGLCPPTHFCRGEVPGTPLPVPVLCSPICPRMDSSPAFPIRVCLDPGLSVTLDPYKAVWQPAF